MPLGLAALLGFGVTLAAQPADPAAPPPRFDSTSLEDLEAMSARLHRRVVGLDIETKPRPDERPLSPLPRAGFGAVLDDGLVVCNALLLDDADRITAIGPRGRAEARAVLIDLERRVALLDAPLERLGLEPSPAYPGEAPRDLPVFARVSTFDDAPVIQGAIVTPPSVPEYEGHPRIDLKLQGGMPVFDDRLRLVGFSRTVAFDLDKFMIVPPAKIRESRTATAAPASPPAPKTPTRPWWAR